MKAHGLTIGDLAARTGLAVSAIRHYESMGILSPLRNAGGHRRYDRSDLRRLSYAMVAQGLGLSLARIAESLRHLPQGRAPSRQDWTAISTDIRADLESRIAQLTALRDRLDGCIGCGCLSLELCALHNPADIKGQQGPGARSLCV
ncbi:redox-sensitive transcriptional activator SoxR [Neogemmobacter tilapiae]|uniref:Redox-sensitive transcriptional activator SoxR n=1 Tax=Neogemmobacter tilapiae TaxID=875041 RepID=A0A918TF27_9RHOB|nr:redox-sensitive transcriptional activator SoxR [Gemmobacter tilapiae]GHC45345.1 redox-sensitive transcriptional activator SoxR [Gemmobacter tilapiae]